MIIEIVALTLFCTLGGILSRMSGGGLPRLPLGLDQWLFAIPFGVLPYLFLKPSFVLSSGSLLAWTGVLIAYLIAFIGKRQGHGQWIDVGNNEFNPEGREKLDVIVEFFKGPDKGFDRKRDLLGLSISGLWIHLGLSIVLLSTCFYFPALLVILGGALKSLAYYLGWKLFEYYDPHLEPEKKVFYELNHPTVFGEIGTGVLSYLSIGLSLMYVNYS